MILSADVFDIGLADGIFLTGGFNFSRNQCFSGDMSMILVCSEKLLIYNNSLTVDSSFKFKTIGESRSTFEFPEYFFPYDYAFIFYLPQ